ncbi:MAG: hypothetical protein EBR30_00720 [Cytophagia bacterium]|jgi:hypothetical protein|nr:hypothetical protein [Cytophagia bacterium]NBW33557.1 hypothetical protein [Cytophagia bacterium]
MKSKSKFLEALDRVMKETDGAYSSATIGTTTGTTTDPEQAGQAAATAATDAGTKEKAAIAAANKAFLAAITNHPTLKGDLTKITPDFIKTLQT